MSFRSVPGYFCLMSLAGVLATTGCGGVDANGAGSNANSYGEAKSTLLARGPYAEDVYGEYQAAANGQIWIKVSTLGAGNLADLASRPLNETLGVPDYQIRMESRGTMITRLTREARAAQGDEWSTPVLLTRFNELGHPVAQATYRLLSVQVTLDAATSEHKALEACWAGQGYCLVMDPVLLQLDAFAQNRKRLLAAGWAPTVTELPSSGPIQYAGTNCTLNSNTTWTGESLTFPAYTVDYKDVFGLTLVHKSLGGQQDGISCYINGAGACVSSGFGYSNASSCYANLGYTCACDNTGNQVGTSSDGSSTKAWSESRCTHELLLNASVSWTIQGVGSGFTISWTTSGSVDANGGQLYDSCGLH